VPNAAKSSFSLRDRLKKHIRLLASQFDARTIPVVLAGLTVLFGAIGWSLQLRDLKFASLAAVLFGVLGNFSPSAKNLADGNLLTQIAAVCGLLTVYASAVLIAANFLRESRRKLIARMFYRNHAVVIGTSPLTQRVSRIWSQRGQRFLQIIPSEGSKTPEWNVRAVRHNFDESLVKAVSLHRAKHVFIDLGDDIQTFSLAFQLLSALPSGTTSDAEWVIVGRDINLSDHFALKLAALPPQGEEKTLPAIHYIDPEQLVARHFMAAHPLFLMAEKQGQPRVHVLIVNFGAIGKHLLESTFLTALTTGFLQPCVTVVTADAETQKKRFFAARPAVEDELDIAFFEAGIFFDLQQSGSEAAKLFRSRDEAAPFTVVILAFEKTEDNIESAFLIDTIGKKLDRMRCPIFAFGRQADETAFLMSRGKFSEAVGGFSLFGLPDTLLELQLCESAKRDALAKALHQHYSDTSSSPAQAWSELPESFRRANRNAADHWRAKLYAFGYDISEIAPGILPKLPGADAKMLIDRASAHDLAQIDAQFMDVVRLEHERWKIERGFDGWSYGSHRDDARQIHPCLISWEKLLHDVPGEALKDVEQIKALISELDLIGDPEMTLRKR